ncbi:MFS transporter [Pseudoduganella umbonata]|uniref:MFS family permease n=1 Tax=Pseudoduganella umbonata TaxID=864828 RepID=A0A4P8HI89_9BURK|nr:MFS transporter [Pseudoduganella umbonata]MBB3224968.1 MFS family permease [Pseudoduganella umbonata]QCP09243.1 MFS transporter [Pseudoduganella umbonata]
MPVIGKTFGALYLSAAVLQFGATLLISHLALRLGAGGASELRIGALMAANALGMAIGASAGRTLIERIGHVRTFAATTGLMVAAVLAHELGTALPFWIVLRAVAGMALMTQVMALESWLNDRAGALQRGRVLAGYMVATYAGMMLGQVGVAAGGGAGPGGGTVIVVAIAFACCVIPVAMTRMPPPAALPQAGITFGQIVRRVPRPLATVFVSGMLNSSFFGLAAIYAAQHRMSPGATAVYLACPVVAGLLAQFPLGVLSDRLPRLVLVRGVAVLLALASAVLCTGDSMPMAALLGFACCAGALQFCLYPLGVAWANGLVDPAMRVGLAGVLLTTFAIGSCIGPLLAGAWMSEAGASSLYAFFAACAVALVLATGRERQGAALGPAIGHADS